MLNVAKDGSVSVRRSGVLLLEMRRPRLGANGILGVARLRLPLSQTNTEQLRRVEGLY